MRIMTTVWEHATSVPTGQLDRYYVLVDKLSVSNLGKRRDRSHITPYAPGTRITERGVSEPHTTCYDELNMPRIMCNPYLARMVFRFFLAYMATDPRFYHLPMAFDYDDGLFYIDRGVVRWIRSRDYRVREADLRLVLHLLPYRRTHACIMWSLDSDELVLGAPFALDFKHGFFWATEYMDRNDIDRKIAIWSREQYVKKYTRIELISTPEEDDANQRLTLHLLYDTPLAAERDDDDDDMRYATTAYPYRFDAADPTENVDDSRTMDSFGCLRIPLDYASRPPMIVFPRTQRRAAATSANVTDCSVAMQITSRMATSEDKSGDAPAATVTRKRTREHFDTAFDEVDQPFAQSEPYPKHLPPLMFNMREFHHCLQPIMSTEAFIFFCLVNGSDWVSHDELFYCIPSAYVRAAIVETIDVDKRNPVRYRLHFDYLVQRIWSKRMKTQYIMSMEHLHRRWKNSRIPSAETMDECYAVVKLRYPYWRTLQGVVLDAERDKLLHPDGTPTTIDLCDAAITPASIEPDMVIRPIVRSDVVCMEHD